MNAAFRCMSDLLADSEDLLAKIGRSVASEARSRAQAVLRQDVLDIRDDARVAPQVRAGERREPRRSRIDPRNGLG